MVNLQGTVPNSEALLLLILGSMVGAVIAFAIARFFRPSFLRSAEDRDMATLTTLFEDAIAAIEDGFVLYDAEDRMFIANEPFRRQFAPYPEAVTRGWTYERQIRYLAEQGFIPGITGKDNIEQFAADMLAKRQSEFGVVKVFKTHDGRWLRQRDKKTAAGNVVGLRTDITELKEKEEELEAARADAEAAARAKATFLANMSHEIRTPMNGIIGMAELLSGTSLDDDQQMYTQTVIDSCSALLTIVNDILDFSKVEEGMMSIRDEPFDVQECLYNVAALLAPSAAKKGLEVCTDIPHNMASWFRGDSGRLRQILINLLGNAIKFTSEGYVVIELAPQSDARGIVLRVRDTGIGIPEEKLATVFSAFEQVDNDSTRQYNGTGLGLAISRRLVDLMGGQIQLQSSPGKGSEFTITLPLEECSPPKSSNGPKLLSVAPAGLRVLIVDDLQLNRLILERNLSAWGVETVGVASGKAALALLKSEPDFDMAIFDFQMPAMDGMELARRVKDDPDIPGFPILLLSSVDRNFDKDTLQRHGFAAALMKPARFATIREAIHRVISEHSDHQPITGLAINKNAFENCRILVAEDNRTNQILITKILGQLGADVTVVETGREALDAFPNLGPDLILMDVFMPEMDGLEATCRIREHEVAHGLSPVPIIALTANSAQEDRDKCRGVGMTDFLSKPFRQKEIIDKISGHLAETTQTDLCRAASHR